MRCSVLVVCCLLLVDCWLLRVVCCVLAVWRLLFSVVCCLLSIVVVCSVMCLLLVVRCCSLSANVRCWLLVVCGLFVVGVRCMFVVWGRYLLFAVLLYVVCCLLC